MAVGEVEVVVPIGGGEGVRTRSEVVSERFPDRCVHGRHLGDARPAKSVEGIDGFGSLESEELPARIRPTILFGTPHVHGTRRAEGNEFMLVHG